MKFSKKYFAKNWFWFALIIVVLFGYVFGKDLAMNDNAQDTQTNQNPTE